MTITQRGGLETQIYTYWSELRKDNSIYFCFTNYEDTGLLDNEIVFDGFHFAYESTIEETQRDVERLVYLIDKKQIDVIHVHPWFAIYPAYFAAARTGIKVVYTYHGTGSINYNFNLLDNILLEEVITSTISHVFCVGQQGFDLLRSIHFGADHISLLPNPINVERLIQAEHSIDRPFKWALVSRLDADKSPTIEKLFSMLNELDIDEIDVYGDGSQSQFLQDLTKTAVKEIRFFGHKNDIPSLIADNGYSGVIGLGRCAIEGLAIGLPVLFIGYGKIVGLIDHDIYERAKAINFVPEGFREKSVTEINEQIQELAKSSNNYNLRDNVINDFDIKTISKDYCRVLETVTAKSPCYVNELFDALTKIELCPYNGVNSYL